MLDVRSGRTAQTHPLQAGTLTLELETGGSSDLFRVAERINPKRSFLFVSTVLGRHIPVRPSDHFAAASALARGCDRIRM
ncbi:MAG: phosphoribosyltransferase domain-containing protein, partial [Myxococcales bacterium]|nr:phosphoribosyltransferase domain-containing protein [Myxococcales bacterium]